MIMMLFYTVPIPDDTGISQLNIHLTVEILFPQIFIAKMTDISREQFQFVIVLSLVVCIQQNPVNFQCINDRFR